MAILTTSLLSIGYKHKGRTLEVQQHLNLNLQAGQLVCLIGPNGAGKSTLMRTLAGLQHPLAGDVYINGKNLSKLSQHEKSLQLSLVLTDRVEIENATVYDLVSIGRHPHSNWWGNISPEDDRLIRTCIEQVQLNHKTNTNIAELSDGERQRVMIAKALAQDTPIIMLDEPTAHLDLPSRVEIMLLLHRLAHQTGKAILLSTHELDLALQAADSIWLMSKDGIECGVPEDLVFNGHFNQVFKSDSFYFNPANGNFSLNYNLHKELSIEGDKTRMYWTLRALARVGYQVVEKAPTHIRVTADTWQVANQELTSVEALLHYLEQNSQPTA